MINQTAAAQSEDLIAKLDDKNIQHQQKLVLFKKKLAKRYSTHT